MLIGLGVSLLFTPYSPLWRVHSPVDPFVSTSSIASSPLLPSAEPVIQYRTDSFFQRATIHSLSIPAHSKLIVVPAVATHLAPLASFVEEGGAIAGVNGGFFDPVNQKTTSYIVLQGEVVADPTQNDRLMSNPDMIPYLEQILDRAEFRQYQCAQSNQLDQSDQADQTIRYDIASRSEPLPEGCQLVASLGAGPRLLPELTLVEEGFADIVNGEVIRDAIGSRSPNARTAIGLTPAGEIILVMAAQRPEMPSESGVSLQELAEFMADELNVEEAMNLDGGSSSALYYHGQTYYGRVNAAGDWVERPIKSVLLVKELSE